MKSVMTIAIVALVAAIGGAGYAEYDRIVVQGAAAKERVFQITRTHIRNPEQVKTAAGTSVDACMRQLHFAVLPPAFSAYIRDYAIIEYDLTKKHGDSALNHRDELVDMRNALSALTQAGIFAEVDTLDEQTLKKTLAVMKDFNNHPRPTLDCIHDATYQTLLQNSQLAS